MPSVHIIVVSHNSERVLPACLEHLERQTRPPATVTVVDSGSRNPSQPVASSFSFHFKWISVSNIGFGRANNLGFRQIRGEDEDLVLFLNPDCFLPPQTLEQFCIILKRLEAKTLCSGKLLGINPDTMRATGRIDSAGIFRKPYGRWFDRGQGELDRGQYDKEELVPALCGALLGARFEALKSLGTGEVFDPDFFLYKEDIELGLRLKKQGWKLLYTPTIHAFHGRGWKSRKEIRFTQRLVAAKSELLLCRKHPSPCMFWAIAKYLGVRYGRL